MLTKVGLASRAGLLTVLFVAASRIWNNSYLADTPATTPGNTSVITAENVQPIFDLMVEYGEVEKKKAGSEKHQFLVVLATSKSEMEESPQWEGLPDSIVGEFPRIDFLLNTNGSYPCANPGHALHGEIVAVDFGCFERILQNFERQRLNDNSKPWQLLFIYSYYVPCSGISDIGYSCAEELMNFARNRHDEFGVIVAYSHVFREDIVGSRKTNEERSLMSLKEGGIITFHRQKKGQYQQVVEYSPPRKVAENATSFQQNMHECLRNFSTADCCALDAADRSRLISSFTNDVTFRCTSKSFKTGLLTEGAKNELWKCMMTVTVSHFVNNCYILATCRSEMSPVTKCLRQTLQLDMWSVLLGSQVSPSDPYSGEWKPFDGPWKSLYLQSPMEDVNGKPVLCKSDDSSKWPLCPTDWVDNPTPWSTTNVLMLMVTSLMAAVVAGKRRTWMVDSLRL